MDAGLSFNDNSDIVTLIDSKGGALRVGGLGLLGFKVESLGFRRLRVEGFWRSCLSLSLPFCLSLSLSLSLS